GYYARSFGCKKAPSAADSWSQDAMCMTSKHWKECYSSSVCHPRKKALARGFHGAWRPPLRGGVQNDGWPWGADRPAEQPGDRAGVEAAPFDEDHAQQDIPDQAPQPARGQGRQPPHPDRRAHEGPAQERRQRRGHEVTAQL